MNLQSFNRNKHKYSRLFLVKIDRYENKIIFNDFLALSCPNLNGDKVTSMK